MCPGKERVKKWNSVILPAALLTAIPLIEQESPPASEQEKHRQIGSTEWLTEENSLEKEASGVK